VALKIKKISKKRNKEIEKIRGQRIKLNWVIPRRRLN
jgi:hypothetical protein